MMERCKVPGDRAAGKAADETNVWCIYALAA
jgi:hypothetical protein